MRLFSQIFQQQVQFPFAVHRHAALDAQSIVLRQEIRVDAGDGNEHFRLTVGAAAVHGHPSAFVAQTVALRGKLRQRLRGKICCRGGRGFAAGIGHRQAQLWQGHPEQAEHNGKYAQPVKQADTQFAHGVTRSLLAQVCPKTGENSQFSHGNAVLCMAECAILQLIKPVMAEDWFLPAFCVRAIIWYCVQLCAHG